VSVAARARGVVAVALAQLRADRTRTVLSVAGVTLAVLATTLLAGTGVSVIETGEEKLDQAGRDLWVTGEVIRLAPGSVGGVATPITDAHALSADISAREGVATASPLLFQTVYVSTDGEEFRTVAGFGAPTKGVGVSEGRRYGRDEHYAGGSYDGPRTREVLVSPEVAKRLSVSVGDTIYVGGTIATAQANTYEVVGVSSTGARFLRAPTVTMPVSELQELTGSTGTDPATLVTLRVAEGASMTAVESSLQAAYPDYEVRTNGEQLFATLRRQAVFLAGGVSLVVLAVVAGLALTANTLLSMVYRQPDAFAALNAVGCSRATLVGVALAQAVVVGGVGTLVGLAATVPAAMALDALAATLVGFENVVRTPPVVFGVSLAVAAVTTLVGAGVAGYRVGHVTPESVGDR
jgi:putative ABC transport system permease protein